MTDSISVIRYVAIISVSIYFVFTYFDGRQVKDEREELIRLKTYEFIQKLTMTALTIIALSFAFFPLMHAFYPVMALVIASMYGEIVGKLYYRRKY